MSESRIPRVGPKNDKAEKHMDLLTLYFEGWWSSYLSNAKLFESFALTQLRHVYNLDPILSKNPMPLKTLPSIDTWITHWPALQERIGFHLPSSAKGVIGYVNNEEKCGLDLETCSFEDLVTLFKKPQPAMSILLFIIGFSAWREAREFKINQNKENRELASQFDRARKRIESAIAQSESDLERAKDTLRTAEALVARRESELKANLDRLELHDSVCGK